MQRVSGGYTILEVTIFLAISAALLGSIVALLSGRQAQVEFDQKMHDTQSKMQSWLNDVSNGFPGGDPSQLKCALNGSGRPVVTVGSPNSTPDCVFLGKALQFSDTPDQSDKIYAYSIFGRRLNSSNQLPTNLTDANPEPAVGPAGIGGPGADLTELFSLDPAQVLWVKSAAAGSTYTTSHLIGFFPSLNTEQTTAQNGSKDINVYQFQIGDSLPGDQSGGQAIQQCLELTTGSCKIPASLSDPTLWPEKLTSFQACLGDGKRADLLTISSVAGTGASVSINAGNTAAC